MLWNVHEDILAIQKGKGTLTPLICIGINYSVDSYLFFKLYLSIKAQDFYKLSQLICLQFSDKVRSQTFPVSGILN